MPQRYISFLTTYDNYQVLLVDINFATYKNKQNLSDKGDIAKKFVNNLINTR